MPELPEVEAARQLIHRSCVGKKILEAIVADDDKVIAGCTADELKKALEGRSISAARRKGKYLWLQLSGPGGDVVLHFGMTGSIIVQGVGVAKYKSMHLEADPDVWPPKYCKLELGFEGGGRLAFVDARRFARVKLQADPLLCEPLSKLGFDCLDELPPPEEFRLLLRQRVARAQGLKIKALLLDQEFAAGIGNWVGDEVLHQARLHPEEPASALSDAQVSELHSCIKAVIDQAVALGADSTRFPKEWLFHYRWSNKKATQDCEGRKIEFVTVGSRTSAFVPQLQKLSSKGAAAASEEDGGGRGKPGKGGAKAAGRKRAAAGGGGGGKAGGKRRKKAASDDDDDDDDDDGGSDEDDEDDVEEGQAGGGSGKAAAGPGSMKAAKAAAARKQKRDGGEEARPAAAKAAKPKAAAARGRKKTSAADKADDDDEGQEVEGAGGARAAGGQGAPAGRGAAAKAKGRGRAKAK